MNRSCHPCQISIFLFYDSAVTLQHRYSDFHGDIKAAIQRVFCAEAGGRHSHARPGPGGATHSCHLPRLRETNRDSMTLHSSHWSNNWSSHWSNMGQLQGQKPRRSSRNAARIRHTIPGHNDCALQAHNPGLPVPMATVSF